MRPAAAYTKDVSRSILSIPRLVLPLNTRVELYQVMDMIPPSAYREMQAQILDHFCERLERDAPSVHERSDAQFCWTARMDRAGGSTLLDDVFERPALIRKIIHAAERVLVHTVQQQNLWIGDFQAAKAQVQAAAEQEFEGWMSRFEAWVDA